MWRLKSREVDEYNYTAYNTCIFVAWIGGRYLGQGSMEDCEKLIMQTLRKFIGRGEVVAEIRTGRGAIISKNCYLWEGRKTCEGSYHSKN